MNYQIQEWSYEAIGKKDMRSIAISVVGYWSRDIITVYTTRTFDGGWDFSIVYGSGGRDSKVEPDDCVAVRNFAEALVAASLIVEELRQHTDRLEAYYQEYLDELRAEAEAERARRQAELDADPALGEYVAKGMIEYLFQYGGMIDVQKRAEDKTFKLTCLSGVNGKRYFYLGGAVKISRKEATLLLATSSHRSDWAVKPESLAV